MSDSSKNPGDVVQGIRRQDNAVIVELAGEVDLHRATELRTSLLTVVQEKPAVMIVSMAGVGFMDSSGLATLVEALQLTRRYGGQLKLVGIQRRVRSIFEIARLDTIFQLYDTEAEALAE